MTSTADGAAGSLRAAIQRANASAEAVRIEVPTGTYELTLCGSDDDNSAGDLDVTTAAPVTIVATGPDVTIKQTCAGERVLDGRGPSVLTLEGVTLTGGNATGDGGAIQGGTVVLTRVHLTSNTASGSGGGIAAATLTGDGLVLRDNKASELVGGLGGGAFVTGEATLRRSRIESNRAARGAGILTQGKLTLSDTAVLGNRASARKTAGGLAQTDGGGVVADALDANRVTFANNYADSCVSIAQTVSSFGSALSARTATLVNTTVVGKFPTCWAYPPGMGPGSAVRVTEALTLDHATVVSDPALIYATFIAAGSLTTRRSLVAAKVCDASTQLGPTAYSWFTDTVCVLNGSGNLQGPGDFRLGDLSDADGVLPTVAPNLASALVDKVPSSACPVTVDARGTARPQGSACDIGAVEAVYPAGFGATDVGVSITAPPSFTPGPGGTWQVQIRNKGTRTAVPTLIITADEPLALSSFTPSAGGSCKKTTYPTDVVTCEFAAVAAGQTATVALTGDVKNAMARVGFTAAVTGPRLSAPFTDDIASTSSAVEVNAALQLEVSPVQGYTPKLYGETLVKITATVRNLGPYNALSGGESPIRLVFKPAPGVATSPQTGGIGAYTLPKDDSYAATFDVIIEGMPTSPLGTIELQPGFNQVSGPVELPVIYVPPSPPVDLTIQVRRQPGVTASGDAVPVEVEVTNHGTSPALDVSARVFANFFEIPQAPHFTWSPPTSGTLSPVEDALLWQLGTVAPGTTEVLRGTAVVAADRTLRAGVSLTNDVNVHDNGGAVSLAPTPLGTADLEVTSVVVRPGESGTQQIARVTITNTGPAAVAANGLSLRALRDPSNWGQPSAVPVSPNGGCTRAIDAPCTTPQGLQSGESAVFDYSFGGIAPGVKVWFYVHVTDTATVDPSSGNNASSVWQ